MGDSLWGCIKLGPLCWGQAWALGGSLMHRVPSPMKHSLLLRRLCYSSRFTEAGYSPGDASGIFKAEACESLHHSARDGEGRGFLLKAQIMSFSTLEVEPENWGVFLYFCIKIFRLATTDRKEWEG